MNKKDFLDELFDKARNETPRFNAEDPLKGLDTPGGGLKPIFKKLYWAAAAVVILVLSTIGITQLSQQDNSTSQKSEQVSENVLENKTLQDSLLEDQNSGVVNNEFGQLDNSQSNPTQENQGNHNDHKIQNDSLELDKQPVVLYGEPDKLCAMQRQEAEHFEIDADKDTMITTTDGTRFYFEGQGFVDKTGRVAKGTIDISVVTCSRLFDYLREDLSTSCGKELLETAGMMNIQATQNHDTLSVRKGYDYGIGLAREIPERMNLYYGHINQQKGIDWILDPVGKTPAPIVVVTSGMYEKVTDPFFYKNYRFEKSEMLQLLDSSWVSHFTSDNRIVMGSRSCNGLEGPYLTACQTFNNELAAQLAKSDLFKVNSRMTVFGFTCYSKNKYAYAMSKGAIDSVASYIPKSDYNYLTIPLFFPLSTGWVNLDCVPTIELKWKKLIREKKTAFEVELPLPLQVNAYLYLPATNSMARTRNFNSQTIRFENIPVNSEARLILTSFHNDRFLVYSADVHIDGTIHQTPSFEYLDDLEDYLNWLRIKTGEAEQKKTNS